LEAFIAALKILGLVYISLGQGTLKTMRMVTTAMVKHEIRSNSICQTCPMIILEHCWGVYVYCCYRFHTGDIIEMVGDRSFKIIDRLKNFFKLSQVCVSGLWTHCLLWIFKLVQGEFVCAEQLENIYLSSVFVDQMYITCADTKKYVHVLICAFRCNGLHACYIVCRVQDHAMLYTVVCVLRVHVIDW